MVSMISVQKQCDELKILIQDLLPLAMVVVVVIMVSLENQCA